MIARPGNFPRGCAVGLAIELVVLAVAVAIGTMVCR
jgi:hypothetical protein